MDSDIGRKMSTNKLKWEAIFVAARSCWVKQNGCPHTSCR